MSDPALHDPVLARGGDPALLARPLVDARASLRRRFDAGRAALAGALEIRYAPELNPPLWELGHVAWFEERWLARNPQRLRGAAADPECALAAPALAGADALYDSSRVEHTRRWHLDLPDADRTLALMARSRERTLALLADSAGDDDALYFFRLALHHEDMHREAWVYMGQHLGLDLRPALDQIAPAAATASGDWALAGGPFVLGHDGPGFVFDNERGAHDHPLGDFTIESAPVRWRAYLPIAEVGGYADRRHWSDAGWAWCQRQRAERPRHLRREDGVWSQALFGRWVDLDLDAPAMHLTHHEAEAWCRWAGRRLPTEAEWECAALTAASGGEAFDWGQVWEWTASAFAPYPGFEPHPYRDYSTPWFDGRPVMRGGSFATAARLKHPRYRNYFTADRNDLFAGFRSCAA